LEGFTVFASLETFSANFLAASLSAPIVSIAAFLSSSERSPE
jgi:hypothetical protein